MIDPDSPGFVFKASETKPDFDTFILTKLSVEINIILFSFEIFCVKSLESRKETEKITGIFTEVRNRVLILAERISPKNADLVLFLYCMKFIFKQNQDRRGIALQAIRKTMKGFPVLIRRVQ